MRTKYRDKILALTKKYRDELDRKDFSHNSDHIFRVENMAKLIAKEEGADIIVIEAACLLFDIARELEDKGRVKDHAEEGVKIARRVLAKINFPVNKIEPVCHAIFVHRRRKDRIPKTLEAKILRDADYLDAMGAIDVARIISSSLMSRKYKRPIYVDEPYELEPDGYKSAIHFMIYKLKHDKHQPKNFFTKKAKGIAKDRYQFSKEYVDRFIGEWHGKR